MGNIFKKIPPRNYRNMIARLWFGNVCEAIGREGEKTNEVNQSGSLIENVLPSPNLLATAISPP